MNVKLNRWITLLYDDGTGTPNNLGEHIPVWRNKLSCFGMRKVQSITSGEAVVNERLANTDTADYYIRRRSDITNNMRLKDFNNVYDIKTVDVTDDGMYIVMHCVLIDE